jgi:hypothetical protein
MFSNLELDSDTDNIHSSPENEIRKAKKKLKAIEKLKYKENLTTEEKIKLENESIWLKIINPSYISPDEQRRNEQDELIRKKEKLKKNIKKDKLKQVKFKKEQERRNREQERRNEEQERRNEEQERRNEEQDRCNREYQERFEHQQRQLLKQQKKISKLEKDITCEFNGLLTQGFSKKKARHKMLLRHHPDKNLGDIVKANKISCIINDFA